MKQLSDGQIAVLIRCCGDSKTDSWHTYSLGGATLPGEVLTWEQDRLAWVGSQHAAAQNALAYLKSRVGK